ncbi:hypothetical protein [Oscillibacter sp.]|uniref:hypothetical protein n=1 Tax=Oscillibacter sp. TaxID=1945593 RepID=UPI00289ACE77|nr:hypothetical protein [Oscillibacter sp.]
MVGNFIGLWIVYLLFAFLSFWGMGALGLPVETLWSMAAQAAFFSLMTCIYIKLTELHSKQKDIEKKLDTLLAQQSLPVSDAQETSSSDVPQH